METPDWAAVYEEYRDTIRAYIHNRVFDGDLADDLTAEVFTKAIRAYAEGKGAHSHLRGWLYRIATNLIIDHFRKRGRVAAAISLEEGIEEVFEIYALDDLDRVHVIEMIERAMARLTALQAEAVRANLAGYRDFEIAKMVGGTSGASKSALHRGRVALREMLVELREVK